MKKLITLLLFFAIQMSLTAQFLEVGMNFNYQVGSRMNGGSRLDTMTISEKKIMDGEEVFLFNEIRSQSNNSIEFLKQDSSRILYYQDSAWHLLYDFDLMPGDTLKVRQPYTFNVDFSHDSSFYLIDSIGEKVEGWKTFQIQYITELHNNTSSFGDVFGPIYRGIGSPWYFFPMPPNLSDGYICLNNVSFANSRTIKFEGCQLTNTSDSIAAISFQIFPNPTNDYLNIILPTNMKTQQMEIFNSAGVRVFKSENLETTIDIRSLPVGFYALKVRSETGDFRAKIFLKI